MARIRLYADSGCDLDKEVLDRLGVKSFQLKVNIKGKTYEDREELSPNEFYRMLEDPNVIPTTSQIGPGELQEEFEKVINETDDHIIYITFSSGLSGTYQVACVARDMVDPQRITVIDSQSASVGYGLTVIRASQAIAAGKSREQVIAEIMDNIKRIEHIFIVGNFDMLKRGGRISTASAFIGNLLCIKVIAKFVDGKIQPVEKVKGLKKAMKRMLEMMEERGCNLEEQLIGINHSNDYEGALKMRDMVQQKFGCSNFEISEIGAVIGSHVGSGTYSVFFLREE